jgi:hypothetical protein
MDRLLDELLRLRSEVAATRPALLPARARRGRAARTAEEWLLPLDLSK